MGILERHPYRKDFFVNAFQNGYGITYLGNTKWTDRSHADFSKNNVRKPKYRIHVKVKDHVYASR